MKILQLICIAAAAALLPSCAERFSARELEYAQWIGLPLDCPLFLAHNVWVEEGGVATPINRQQTGRLVPFGTEVKLMEAKEGKLVLKVVGSNDTLIIVNDKSETCVSDREAFLHMLGRGGKTSLSDGVAPETLAKIELGLVEVGMTKDEVLLSQGVPMKGRTPLLDSDTWTYHIAEQKLRRVIFKNGKVNHVLSE